MKKLLPASLFLALFVSARALAHPASTAEQCKDMRLDGPGQAMEHVPTLDQSRLESCYAFEAAALLDAYRFSAPVPPGDRDYGYLTSPVEGALTYAIEYNEPHGLDDGGDACELVDQFRDDGSCSTADVRKLGNLLGMRPSDMINALQVHYDTLRAALSSPGDPTHHPDGTRANSAAFDAAARVFASNVFHCGDQARRLEDLLPFSRSELVDALLKPTSTALLQLIVTNACREHRKVAGVSCAEDPNPKSPEQALRQINAGLDLPAPTQPVGISICANVIDPRPDNLDGSWVNYNQETPGVTSDCRGSHQVIVFGRRFLNGRCEFLIRNTWGTGCDSYPSDIECEHGTGNLWIDAGAVARNTFETFHLH